jgi:hypothetical protein
VEELDPRELCDVAYAAITGDLEKHYYALVAGGMQWKDTEDPLGESIIRFEERIGLRDDPEALAMEMHKRFMAAQGKEWDDTPVGAGSGQWWDQDAEFTDMSALDGKRRRQ